ncbi:MAG: HAD-IC family P-type ATPase [Actinobacteria bacterium]|nr:HAD-IC family P-type ATPase [Actinomycetota bacterium]
MWKTAPRPFGSRSTAPLRELSRCMTRFVPPRPRTVAALRRQGAKEIIMLTGDNAAAAERVAKQCDVDRVFAEILPTEKVDLVRELQRSGRKVMLVGDGVNDAPALAAANLGIAMGHRGTDIALETADIVLVNDSIELLPGLMKVSRRANRLVRHNLVFAFAMITLLVTLDLAGRLPLPLGVVGHEGSTMLVALNGLRVLGALPDKAE